MAQEFIKELERLKAKQAEQGGLNAPAPVAPGFQPQAPQELSAPEFGPTLDKEAPLDVLAPSVESPKGQVPMLGGFEVRGDGAERFALGTPEVPETLSSELYGDPGGNTAAIAGIEDERARANAVDPQVSVETPGTRNFVKEGFDYFFGAPTAEQAQNTLDTMPTDPDQRARLQATAAGEGVPSDLSKAGSFFFGRPEVAGDPNTLGAQAPAVVSDDPFGVTPEEIAAAGNENFGKAVAENPYRSQYGVNSLEQSAVDEIQQQDTAAPQAQLPSTIQNAGGQNLAGFKPKYEGQSLTDYMAGRDDPSAASVQVQDPQGRFRRQAASVAGETPEQNQSRTDALFPEQADFEQASADREARQAARPDFGEAVSDRDRRAARGDDMSDADRRDIAKGSARGASAGDVARAMKVAGLNNVDVKTGESLNKKDTRRPDQVEQDRLNLIRTEQIIEDGNKTDATPNQKLAAERQVAVGKRIITQAQADEANKIDLIGKPTNTLYDTWAEWEAATGIDQDKDGKVSTKEDAKSGRLSKVDQSRLQALRNKDKK